MKVVQALREEGQYDTVPVYAENTSYVVDYISMLALMIRDALTREAVDFSIRLMQYESGPQLDVTQVMELFMSHNLVQETTAFLLEALKYNRPPEGPLQTRLLEINLQMAPQVTAHCSQFCDTDSCVLIGCKYHFRERHIFTLRSSAHCQAM